jgi:CTD nuclear envelope phosphatase 1
MILFVVSLFSCLLFGQIANGIPIEGWTHDPSDEALLDLLPVLDSLRFTSDVRRVLGLRSAGVSYT